MMDMGMKAVDVERMELKRDLGMIIGFQIEMECFKEKGGERVIFVERAKGECLGVFFK